MAANPSKPSAITPAVRSGALAPAADPINDALRNAGYLDAVLAGSANLVSPIFAVDQTAEGTRLSVRMVRVRPDRDCYKLPGGKVALLKTALDQIAGAAQVDWAFSGQVDDWHDPYRVKYHAVAVVRNPDGTLRRLPGTKVLDLRKTADFVGEDAVGMSDRELQMARKHIHALAESKAMNRAIRRLGIASGMTEQQAAQPWVVVALVPDMSHPEMRRAMIQSLAGNQALLYGHTQPEAPRALPAEIEAGEDFGDAVDVSGMVEAPEGDTVDAAAPEDITGPDPWDTPAATPAKACRLPVSEAILDQVPPQDEERMRYLSRLNAVAKALFAELGAERAKAIIAHAAPDFDALTWPLPQIATLGMALRKEMPGGGR